MKPASRDRRILLIANANAPLGHPLSGGVPRVIAAHAAAFERMGYAVDVMAPEGETLGVWPNLPVSGKLHTTLQHREENGEIHQPLDSVLARMMDLARERAGFYDRIINYSHDWLPFYLSGFFEAPKLLHYVNLSVTANGMETVVKRAADMGTCAFMSTALRDRFEGAEGPVIPGCVDVAHYPFNGDPQPVIGWAGRIAREKGLEDAFFIARMLGMKLIIMGAVQDEGYWKGLTQTFGDVDAEVLGFLEMPRFAEALSHCAVLLMTSRWLEAFGMVVVEALAAGVPVATYDNGGPAEIVLSHMEKGEVPVGVVAPRGDRSALARAVKEALTIDRRLARAKAERHYSLKALEGYLNLWVNV